MAARPTVSVEIDLGTVGACRAIAAREGNSVGEWIARAAHRVLASTSPGPNYVEVSDADMLAEDTARGTDDAAIATEEARRFRAAG